MYSYFTKNHEKLMKNKNYGLLYWLLILNNNILLPTFYKKKKNFNISTVMLDYILSATY